MEEKNCNKYDFCGITGINQRLERSNCNVNVVRFATMFFSSTKSLYLIVESSICKQIDHRTMKKLKKGFTKPVKTRRGVLYLCTI